MKWNTTIIKRIFVLMLTVALLPVFALASAAYDARMLETEAIAGLAAEGLAAESLSEDALAARALFEGTLLAQSYVPMSGGAPETEPVLFSTQDFREAPVGAGSGAWVTGAAPNGADAFVVPVGGTSTRIGDFPTHADYYVWEMDIMFTQSSANSGFVPFNQMTGGNQGLSIQVTSARQLHGQGGSNTSRLSPNYDVQWNQWYHMEIIFLPLINFGNADVAGPSITQSRLILTPYNADGELIAASAYRSSDVPLRNFGGVREYFFTPPRNSPTVLEVFQGTSIANFRVLQAWPDVITLTAPSTTVSAGETLQLDYTASRKGFASPPVAERTGDRHVHFPVVGFDLLSMDGTPLTSPMVAIDAHGLITVAANAHAMEFQAVATSVNGVKSNPITITTVALDVGMFEVVKFGVETSDGTADGKLVRVGYVDVKKLFEFDNPVTFTVALFDNEGYLIGVSSSTMKADWMIAGETTRVNLNLPLPDEFNPNTWTLRLFSWTGL